MSQAGRGDEDKMTSEGPVSKELSSRPVAQGAVVATHKKP